MRKGAYINVRVENEIKNEVDQILNVLGINMSTAINIYLYQIKLNKGLPFPVKTLQSKYNKRIKELAEALNMTGGKTFPGKFDKLLELYANDDIDFDTAMYVIKREYTNV